MNSHRSNSCQFFISWYLPNHFIAFAETVEDQTTRQSYWVRFQLGFLRLEVPSGEICNSSRDLGEVHFLL
jgi:hypothetical protein